MEPSSADHDADKVRPVHTKLFTESKLPKWANSKSGTTESMRTKLWADSKESMATASNKGIEKSVQVSPGIKGNEPMQADCLRRIELSASA